MTKTISAPNRRAAHDGVRTALAVFSMARYKSLFSTQSWLILDSFERIIYCPTLATLEMRKELEPKCVPQWFLGLLLGTRLSAIGQCFSLSQVTIRKTTWPSLLLISKVANYPTFLGVSLFANNVFKIFSIATSA